MDSKSRFFAQFFHLGTLGLVGLCVFSTQAGFISQDYGGPAWGIPYNYPAQTFTAEDSRISTVSFYISNEFQSASEVQCFIFAGIGTNLQALATASATVPLGFKAYANFDFSSVVLTPGAKYTLALRNGSAFSGSLSVEGNQPGIQGSGPDYAGGEAILFGQVTAEIDLRFRIVPAASDVSVISISSTRIETPEQSETSAIALTRSGGLDRTVQVDYATATPPLSSAVAGVHYLPASGTVTFAPGESTKSISLGIINDNAFQTNKVFVLQLSPATPDTLLDARVINVIIIDDDIIDFHFDTQNPRVAETDLRFTIAVERSGKINQPSSVRFHFRNGTAVLGEDFLATDGQLDFAPGEARKEIQAEIIEDNLLEGEESFLISVEPVPGSLLLLTNISSFVTIQDTSTEVRFQAKVTNVLENIGTFPLTLERVGNLQRTDTITYQTEPSAALPEVDFLNATGHLTFLPGESSKTIELTIVDDIIAEPSESFFVRLSAPAQPAYLSIPERGVVTILNDSAFVEFVSTNFTASEATRTVRLGLRRTGLLKIAASVLYLTTPDSAIPGADYTARSGQVDFAVGQTEAFIDIPLLDDELPEGTEKFQVTLSPGSGNLIVTNGTAQVDLVDDNALIQFATTNIITFEKNAETSIEVKRTGNLSKAFTVDYASENGTAVAGTHFTSSSGKLQFAAGETTKAIVVPILNNSSNDGDVRFQLKLSHPVGEVLLGTNSNIFVQIGDDDQTVKFAQQGYNAYPLSGSVQLLVSRGAGLLAPTEVSYQTEDGTATSDLDYIPQNGVITFQPGQAMAIITVGLRQRSPSVIGSFFTVRLSGSGDATIGEPSRAKVIFAEAANLEFDYSFFPDVNSERAVTFLARQPSGKILYAAPILQRLNADGSPDVAFNRPLGSPEFYYMQKDGRVLCAQYTANREYLLSRITADGLPDDTFPNILTGSLYPEFGPQDEIYFYDVLGPKTRRYNKDGELDSSFQLDYTGIPYSFIADEQGKIYIGLGRNSIRRFSHAGAFEAEFADPTAVSLDVSAVSPDARIYVTKSHYEGYFLVRSTIRLLPDFTLDSSWKEKPGLGSFIFLPDSRILSVFSAFLDARVSSGSTLVLLNNDGTRDSSFSKYVTGPVVLTKGNPGEFLLGGSPISVDLEPFPKIARLSVNAPAVVEFSRPDYHFYNDTATAFIKLNHHGSLARETTIHIASENGSARADVDFIGIDRDIVFASGEREKLVEITLQKTAIAQPIDFSLHLTGSSTHPKRRENAVVRVHPVPLGNFVPDLNFSVNPLGNSPLVPGATFRPVAIQSGKGILSDRFFPGSGDRLMRFDVNGDFDPSFHVASFKATNVLNRIEPTPERILLSAIYAPAPLSILPDGDPEPDFGSPIPYGGAAILPLASGKIYVAGSTTYPNHRIALLNSDGSLDTSFAATLGAPNDYSPISDLGVQSNGKLLASGSFLKRLNADGSLDMTFAEPQPDKYISDLSVPNDDTILVAGGFTTIAGHAAPGVARLNTDGKFDSTFHAALPAGEWVYCVTPVGDGTILVGGSFPGGIKMLNSSGELVPFFTSVIPNGAVHQILIEDSQNIILAGEFTDPGNSSGVARLTTRRLTRPILTAETSSNGWPLSIQATAGHPVQLHWSDDLIEWKTFLITNAAASTIRLMLPFSPEVPRRFYRVRQD